VPVTQSIDKEVQAALKWLKAHGTRATLDGMARCAIPSDKVYGVAIKDIAALGKKLGCNHEFATALWDTGVYEARTLASYVGDPAAITSAQMDRWCKEIDHWGLCNAMSYNLFNRTPYAWNKVAAWSKKRNELGKSTAFVLLRALALHDKQAGDSQFVHALAFVERGANDPRYFINRAVNMALRAVGERNQALNAKAQDVARRLARSANDTTRWVGKNALRELSGPSVIRRLTVPRVGR
jgi:3-methyladenine DNA glycosylase AlkD